MAKVDGVVVPIRQLVESGVFDSWIRQHVQNLGIEHMLKHGVSSETPRLPLLQALRDAFLCGVNVGRNNAYSDLKIGDVTFGVRVDAVVEEPYPPIDCDPSEEVASNG